MYEGRLAPAAPQLPERPMNAGLGGAAPLEPSARHPLRTKEASASLAAAIEGLALSPRTPHPPADLAASRSDADLAASQAGSAGRLVPKCPVPAAQAPAV